MIPERLSIVHFSTSDTLGGSANSANRIHRSLRSRGHDSRMLVGYRFGNDQTVQSIATNRFLKLLDRVADKLCNLLGYQYYFVPSSLLLRRHSWLSKADIFQLFNIHGGYLSLRFLEILGKKAPIVWRLSDLWPVTGHCAYPGDCEKWMAGCGNCPDLQTYPAIGTDRTAELFEQKKRLYASLNLTIVAPSSWTEKQARKSPLFNQRPIVRIPNGLDDEHFGSPDRVQTRDLLGLPRQEKIILFCAHMLDDNPRKGGEVLIEALNIFGKKKGYTLLLMGEGGEAWAAKVPMPVRLLGFQDDVSQIALAYAASDLVVIPSVLENLPNTLIESLASSRAVIASDCGGMRDGVVDGETGFLVPVGDASRLASKIEQLLDDDDMRHRFELNARKLFENEFSVAKEASRFESLYADLVTRERTEKSSAAV